MQHQLNTLEYSTLRPKKLIFPKMKQYLLYSCRLLFMTLTCAIWDSYIEINSNNYCIDAYSTIPLFVYPNQINSNMPLLTTSCIVTLLNMHGWKDALDLTKFHKIPPSTVTHTHTIIHIHLYILSNCMFRCSSALVKNIFL